MGTSVYSVKARGRLVSVLAGLDKDESVWAIKYLTDRLAGVSPYLSGVSSSQNRDKLLLQLSQISADVRLKEQGMADIPQTVLDSMTTFLDVCPDDSLLADASCAPRINGTMLLCWNKTGMLGSVNIGSGRFSYAVYRPDSGAELSGEGLIRNEEILGFYHKLKKML